MTYSATSGFDMSHLRWHAVSWTVSIIVMFATSVLSQDLTIDCLSIIPSDHPSVHQIYQVLPLFRLSSTLLVLLHAPSLVPPWLI